MKHTSVSLLLLAGLGDARPMPQFSWPSFSVPSFSLPTGGFGLGSGTGSGLGSGFGLPSLGGLPAATSTAKATTTAKPATTTVQATAAPTSAAAAPTSTGSSGSVGTIGSDCTPQSGSGGGTENGVTDKNCCTGVTVIFARGTGEMGNVGTISGPPMAKSLRSKLGDGKVTIQGVDYPADAAVSFSATPPSRGWITSPSSSDNRTGKRESWGIGWTENGGTRQDGQVPVSG